MGVVKNEPPNHAEAFGCRELWSPPWKTAQRRMLTCGGMAELKARYAEYGLWLEPEVRETANDGMREFLALDQLTFATSPHSPTGSVESDLEIGDGCLRWR